MVKPSKPKPPYEAGYDAGLSGLPLFGNPFNLADSAGDYMSWERGHAAGKARKAEYDAEDAPPETVVARVALEVAQAKAVAAPVDKLALPIEADGYEIADALEKWLADCIRFSDQNCPAEVEERVRLYGGPGPGREDYLDGQRYGLRFARGLRFYLGVS